MNRLIICLAVVAMSNLVIENASAQHRHHIRGHRVVRHGHAVHRAPVVIHGHAAHRAVPRHYGYYAPHVYPQRHGYGAAYVYPHYGHSVVRHHGYPAQIYVGRPGFSLRIGF